MAERVQHRRSRSRLQYRGVLDVAVLQLLSEFQYPQSWCVIASREHCGLQDCGSLGDLCSPGMSSGEIFYNCCRPVDVHRTATISWDGSAKLGMDTTDLDFAFSTSHTALQQVDIIRGLVRITSQYGRHSMLTVYALPRRLLACGCPPSSKPRVSPVYMGKGSRSERLKPRGSASIPCPAPTECEDGIDHQASKARSSFSTRSKADPLGLIVVLLAHARSRCDETPVGSR